MRLSRRRSLFSRFGRCAAGAADPASAPRIATERRPAVLVAAALSALIGGCGSAAPPASMAPPVETTSGASLQPGDAIRVQVWREPDLSGTFDVDDRGLAVLPLLGERQVTDLAPNDLRAALVEDYAVYLRNPSVQVTLLRRISVLGEVRNPSLYSVDATVSLADAIAVAGGIGPGGNPGDIRLIRDGQVILRDMDQATLVGSEAIRSGDQIVVGQKSWASRNSGALVGSLIAASAIIAAALIR